MTRFPLHYISLRLFLPSRSVHSISVLIVFKQIRPLFVLRVQYFIVGRCFYTSIEYVLVATPNLIPALISSGTPSWIFYIYCYILTMVDYRLAPCFCVVLFQVRLDAESKQRKAVCFLKFLALDRRHINDPQAYVLTINQSQLVYKMVT